MTPKQPLYLASKSSSRQQLLTQANIPFTIVEQNADETQCDWNLPLQKIVEGIALYKMAHAIVPTPTQNNHCFVLTADTLSQDAQGAIHGKPIDRADAIEKIKAARNGMLTGTAFCIDKKVWRNDAWVTDQRIVKYVQSQYEFNIPDGWIDDYLKFSYGLNCSGAIAIEGYGGLFLKKVEGSYTTIVGLPLYEVREALEKIGFFAQ